jgi:hypothetical protein
MSLCYAMRGVATKNYASDPALSCLLVWRRIYHLATLKEFRLSDALELAETVPRLRHEASVLFRTFTKCDFHFPTQHELEHLAEDMIMFGSCSVTDTKLFEHEHIEAVKDPFIDESNHTFDEVSLWKQILNAFFRKRLAAPYVSSSDGDGSGRNKQVGASFKKKFTVQGIITARVTAAIQNRVDWNLFFDSYQSTFYPRTEISSLLKDELYVSNSFVLNEKRLVSCPSYHLGLNRYDVFELNEPISDCWFGQVRLIFSPVLRRRTPYFWIQLLKSNNPLICDLYGERLVHQTPMHCIVEENRVKRVWYPVWIAQVDNQNCSYFLREERLQ